MKRPGPAGAVGEGAEVPEEASCKGTDGRLHGNPYRFVSSVRELQRSWAHTQAWHR
jgi:hypothetical protein